MRRPKWEGGEYEGEDEPPFDELLLAMELGAEYVDIDLKVGLSSLLPNLVSETESIARLLLWVCCFELTEMKMNQRKLVCVLIFGAF